MIGRILSAVVLVAVVGCGEASYNATTEGQLEGDFVRVPEVFQVSQGLGVAGRGIVYVNIEGQRVKNGGSSSRANTSFIVPQGVTAEIPALNPGRYGYSDRTRLIEDVLTLVKQDYAQFDVAFTTTRPTSGDYTMVLVGGTPALISQNAQTAGIAPLDLNNPNRNDIVFAFSDVTHTVRELANCISHELGHSFGLEHQDGTDVIMYPTLSWDKARWARANIFQTNRVQDDVQLLNTQFGSPGSAAPQAAADVGASFISQRVPTTIAVGQQFETTLTFKNTGSRAWEPSEGFTLVAPDATWGGSVFNFGKSVPVGQSISFQLVVRAPDTAGTYSFTWRVALGGIPFGAASSANINVTATPVANAAPIGKFESVTTARGQGWAYDADAPDMALWVDIFIDGKYAGSVQANQPRTDLAGSSVTGNNHGFAFATPALAGTHTYTAYAQDHSGQSKTQLVGSFSLTR